MLADVCQPASHQLHGLQDALGQNRTPPGLTKHAIHHRKGLIYQSDAHSFRCRLCNGEKRR